MIPFQGNTFDVNAMEDPLQVRLERDALRAEVEKLQRALKERDISCNVTEEELLRVRKVGMCQMYFITSCVSSQARIISPVCISVSVYLSALSQLKCLTCGHEIWYSSAPRQY